MNNNQKTTKEIYEEFYKKPIEEITREDIGECKEIDWGQDVGGERIEDDYDPNDPFYSESNIKHLEKIIEEIENGTTIDYLLNGEKEENEIFIRWYR